MKISYSIFLGFLFILILFTITTVINVRLSEKVRENSTFLEKSAVVVRSGNRFQRNLLNMVSGLRGYLLTGESSFLQSYDSATQENEVLLQDLETLVSDEAKQLLNLEEIQSLNTQLIDQFANPLMEARKTSATSDSSLHAFQLLYREKLASGLEKTITDRLQTKFRDFSNYEYNLRDERKATLEASMLETRTISYFFTAISVILGVIISGFLAYRISSRIVKMVKMSDEIAHGNYLVYIEDKGKDELSGLAKSLNHMSRMLTENITLLKRKNMELDQFAHIVSHDLKAPLRGIDNVVTWIEEDHTNEISPKVHEFLQLIKGRVVRAENLIRGILSYARIGKDEEEKGNVDTGLLLSEIIDNLPSGNGITISVQPGMPVFITEKLPLQMIFTNLMTNAITYNNKADGEVKISCEEHPAYFRFLVSDNGPGIAKNYHDKIFIIFQTLAERDQPESTGVGLAIVKKILDERNQSIQIISEPGKGSTFAFTWPKH